MTSFPRRLTAALLILLVLAPYPAGAARRRVLVHLCVVPQTLPDGSDAAGRRQAFETWLGTEFGGYTRLGQGQGGWKNESGQLETQANTVYLVTAQRDIAGRLAERIGRDFGERVPYVLVFPAGLLLTRGQ